MKKSLFVPLIILFLVYVLTACKISSQADSIKMSEINIDDLYHYKIAYCWMGEDADIESADPNRKRIDVVIQSGNGEDYIQVVAHRQNSLVYQLGCSSFTQDGFPGKANRLSWKPNSNILSATKYSTLPLEYVFFDIDNGDQSYNLVDFETTDFSQILDGQGIYWSNTGGQFATIARGSKEGYLDENVWIYDFVTKEYRQVTFYTDVAADYATNVTWSNQSNKIAVGYGEPYSGIEIISFDSKPDRIEVSSKNHKELSSWRYEVGGNIFGSFSQKTDLTVHIYKSSRPNWVDIDGYQKIIFVASNPKMRASLFMIDDNGLNLIELLPNRDGLIAQPIISPDGKTLAFVEYEDWSNTSYANIVLLDLLTMKTQTLVKLVKEKQVTNLRVGGLDWTPDGLYLAFASNFKGQSDIYVISKDGKAWVNLTSEYSGDATSPVWKP